MSGSGLSGAAAAAVAGGQVGVGVAIGAAAAVNDVNETRAINHVFGNAANNLSISSTKSMHGHTLGACGDIEAAASIKALEENFVPPTIGLAETDPECDLDYVPNTAREMKIDVAFSNSFCFGGTNGCLLLGATV